MGTIFGYARCSTNETKQDVGYQIRELKKLGATKNTIYLEYESGAKVNRPELLKLMGTVNPGDFIVVTEVSRLTRSTKHLCEIIDECKEKRLKLIIQNSITIDCTSGELDHMTEAFLQMAGVFAQLERSLIRARIKSGIQNARAKGVRLGRPSLTIADIPTKVKTNYDKYKDGLINKIDYARICDISRPTLDKYIGIIVDQ